MDLSGFSVDTLSDELSRRERQEPRSDRFEDISDEAIREELNTRPSSYRVDLSTVPESVLLSELARRERRQPPGSGLGHLADGTLWGELERRDEEVRALDRVKCTKCGKWPTFSYRGERVTNRRCYGCKKLVQECRLCVD